MEREMNEKNNCRRKMLKKVLLNSFLLSLAIATILLPYVPIPSMANNIKYCTIEFV
jgi:hypothetical protein